MTLAELLEYTAKDYLDDRTDLVDGDADEYWSDATLTRYLNEAQRVLARRAWVLIDIGHPQAGVITLQADRAVYPLHKSVLHMFKATPADSDLPLSRTTDAGLSWRRGVDPDYFDINDPLLRAAGRPQRIATDAAFRKVRVDPVPGADEQGLKLVLKVARLPVCVLDINKLNDSPEVPEEWHFDLCKFAAGKALQHPRVDSERRAMGRTLLAEFDQVVQEARRDRHRLESVPVAPVFASSTACL